MSFVTKPRRTFAIISHPDAGKTTLTEKLLYEGGAIHMAGAVKTRGEQRRSRSDWMKIEQQRGISVTSSVMTFEYGDVVCNLLDTPGHEDFSEDTYRTLTAVDAAIMVIDAARGIEAQTRKLFEVCRLRDIPIVTFINKVDREGRDPFELLDEIQETLALDITPAVWPIGMGQQFHGCYDLGANQFLSFNAAGTPANTTIACETIHDAKLDKMVPETVLTQARESAELAIGGYSDFDSESFQAGHLSPVIFGSAIRGVSVKPLLDMIVAEAPGPGAAPGEPRSVLPDEENVTGFVFKVQANMDKNHRDRIAFMRVCSGRFRRGMKLNQVRTGKDIIVHSPTMFLAQDRAIVEDAAPGDVIGIPNHGTVRVGDTFSEGEALRFTGIPVFAPETLRRVRLDDTTRIKQMRRALEDLAEEGLIQVFKPRLGSQWVVGVVGTLQLDVLADRAKQEYRVDIAFEGVPFEQACWLRANDEKVLRAFTDMHTSAIMLDRDDRPVFLARNAWELNYMTEKNPDLEFLKTRELE